MGKGDKKTKRGKIVNKSYGKLRPKKKSTGYTPKPKKAAEAEPKASAPKKKAAVKKKAPAKKTATKKTATKKATPTKGEKAK